MSQDHTRDDVTVAQVLAIAGGGSAAAAGLIIVLDKIRHRRQPRRIDRVRDSLEHGLADRYRLAGGLGGSLPQLARRTGDQAKRRAARGAGEAARIATLASAEAKMQGSDARRLATERLHRLRADAADKGGDLAQAVDRQLHQIEGQAKTYAARRPALDVDQLQQKGEELMNATQRSFTRARRSAAPVLKSARHRAPEIGDQVTDMASDRVRRVAEYAVDMSRSARERAAKVDVSDVQSRIEPAAESLRESTSRLKEDVAPAIRDAALQAAAAAISLWEATRAQADEIDREELRAWAGESFSEALERAKHAGSAASESVAALARDRSDDVKERADEARQRAGEFSRHAVDATTQTTKDATATLVWAGIAGGLIYYGLLDQSQRERVDSMVKSVYGGATELVRDIQGYDADFGNA